MKKLILLMLLCAPAWAQERVWTDSVTRELSATSPFTGDCRSWSVVEGGWLLSPCQKPEVIVRNLLNPDAFLVRDGLVEIVIKNGVFTDETVSALPSPQVVLAGVQVWIDGAPQPIRSAAPQSIVIIPDRRGGALSRIAVQTKRGDKFEQTFFAVDAWPSIVPAGAPDSELRREFIPLGYWGDPRSHLQSIGLSPIPVGPTDSPTFVFVYASGARHAWPGGVEVRLNGIQCKVLGVNESLIIPGEEEVVFVLPAEVAGRGSMDLTIQVGSRTSNYARLVIGDKR